jgi:hypothetical protein
MFRTYRDDEPSADAPSTEEMEYRKTFYPSNLANHNLIIWVVEHLKDAPGGIPREDGKPTDAIVVDVVDLDRPDQTNRFWGALAEGMWWRAGTVIGKLRPFIGGEPILVRLAAGFAPGSKYKTFSFIDVSGDPNIMAKANAWMQWNPQFQPSRPTPSQMQAPLPPPATPAAPPVPQHLGPPGATPHQGIGFGPPGSIGASPERSPSLPTGQPYGASHAPYATSPGAIPEYPGLPAGYGPAPTAAYPSAQSSGYGPPDSSPPAPFPASGAPGWRSQPMSQDFYATSAGAGPQIPSVNAGPPGSTLPTQNAAAPESFHAVPPPPPPLLPPPTVDPAFQAATLERLRRVHQVGPLAPNPQIDPALQSDEPPF